MITPLLDYLYPRRCVGCGREGQSWICQQCVPELPDWNGTVAEGVYALAPLHEAVVREALHGLKYHSLHELADELVSALWTKVEALSLPEDTVLVPVPTSFSRLKSRGYNQAELLARSIGRRTGFAVCSKLLQKASKGTQVGKTRAEREVATHYRRTKHPLPVGSIVLIDDVRTTGSTLLACANALGVPLKALVIAQD